MTQIRKAFYLLRIIFLLPGLLAIGFVIFPGSVCAQLVPTNGKYGTQPVLIPASPEVAELSRIGQLGSELFTGASRVNIPLHELKAGDLKVPIALAYSNNGVRVNDIPSRVGLGFNLVAGGSLSRTIHDEPDDQSIQLAPVNFANQNNQLLDYLFYATTSGYDTERDIYSINAPGLSGRFFLDNTGTPRFIEHSGLKVQVNGSPTITSFTVTNTEGHKYYFGQSGAIETTREIILNGLQPKFKNQKTTWFLTRIENLEGDYIEFTYSPIYIKTIQGISQTVTLSPNIADTPPEGCGVCESNIPVVQYDKLDYDTYYLHSILTSDGTSASFNYALRNDQSGDNRLVSMSLMVEDQIVKTLMFEYLDNAVGAGVINGKFFLKQIVQTSQQAPSESILLNKFDYISPGTLPGQLSLSQDYLGYFNNAQNGNFYPRFAQSASYINGQQGADREPNSFAQYGALSKVTFSTGGYDEYRYGPHTLSTTGTFTTWTNRHNTTDGAGTTSPKTVQFDFGPVQSQTADLIFTVSANPGGPTEGDPNYGGPNGTRVIATLEFRKTLNNELITKKTFFDYGTQTYPFSLTAGVDYKAIITVNGQSNQASASIKYDPVTTVGTYNKAVCGIRVDSIFSYDPVRQQTLKKYFTYASQADTTASSGFGYGGAAMVEGGTSGWCPSPLQFGSVYVTCNNVTVYSSNLQSPQAYGGSNVAYQYVLESDDRGLANGCIEHTYITSTDGTSQTVINSNRILGLRNFDHIDFAGKETSTKSFRKLNDQLVLLQKTDNFYGLDTRVYYEMPSYAARKKHGFSGNNPEPVETKLLSYDLNKYVYTSGWIRPDSVITTLYGESGDSPFITRQLYTYNNPANTVVSTVKTFSSKAQPVEETMKYPTDFTDAVSVKMVAKNLISPLIEKRTLVNNSLTDIQHTTYKDWFGDSRILKPELLKSGQSTVKLDTVLHYYTYNTRGRVVSLAQERGPRTTYIWGYKQRFPIAELRNADYATLVTALAGETNVTKWENVLPSESELQIFFSQLRSNTTLKPSLIRTFSYLPEVGMKMVTDESGRSTYYEYDGIKRLSVVKDNQKDIVKHYQYNYQLLPPGAGVTYSSERFTQEFRRNNCGSNAEGSIVVYEVVAGKYTSTISQADANSKAETEAAQQGQSNANQIGTCTTCSGTDKKMINGRCVTATKTYTRSVWEGTAYKCFFTLSWPDGTQVSGSEMSPTPCVNGGPDLPPIEE